MTPTPSPLFVMVAEPDTRAAFTIEETAHLLGVSVKTVRKAISQGRLHAVQMTERSTKSLVPAWSIEALLAPERRVTVVEDGAFA